MRTDKDIKKKATELSVEEQKKFKTIIEEIKFILDSKKVNEDLLQRLSNTIIQLDALKNGYMWRIIRCAKQNHIID